jgi:hypothetical protein
MKGSKVVFRDKARVSSTGRIDNYSRRFTIRDRFRIDEGDGETTGVIYNHNLIRIKDGGRITGRGTIINYSGFALDESETERAENYMDEGYLFEPLTDEEYDYSRLTPEQLRYAARYDLVNEKDNPVTEFYKVKKTRIKTPHKGQIPGAPAQEEAAKRYMDGTITVETRGDKTLPSTDGSAASEAEFKQHNQKGYDVSGQQLTLTVDEPAYYGESLFSVGGFNSSAENGTFTINGGEYEIPEVDQNTIIRKTGNVPYEGAEGLSFEPWNPGNSGIEDYYDGTEWTSGDEGTGDPVAIFAGDNSWFNGVFSLEHGGAIIDNRGSMFGGQINLGRVEGTYPTAQALHEALNSSDESIKNAALISVETTPATEFESQGGAKDEYNRPSVYMNGNATMYFNIPEDENGDRVFSWYGDIHSTPYDRIIFQQGRVLVKGDCSGFQGKIGVCQGAEFKIASSDETSSSDYKGVMFGGSYEVVDENGVPVPDGKITVDSSSGLKPLILTSGTMVIKDESGGDEEKHTIDDITVDSTQGEGGAAAVRMDYGDSVLNNTKVIGKNSSLHLDGGEEFHFNNFTLREGVLNIAGEGLERVSMEGEVSMGSSIAAWTNSVVDSIHVNDSDHMTAGALPTAAWSLTDDVKLYFDFDPAAGTADHFVSSTGVTSGLDKKFVLQGVRLLNIPTAQKYYFRLLDFKGTPTERYPEIVIADRNFTVIGPGVTVAPDGISIASGAPYPVSKTSDGITAVDINGATYYFYGSNRAGKGKVLMTRTLFGTLTRIEGIVAHVVGLGAISSTLETVFDEFGYVYKHKENNGKYSFWAKTHALSEKHKTIDDNVKLNRYGTILGFDGKSTQFTNSNTFFTPTVFAGITRNNAKLDGTKARQIEFLGGLKMALFNSRFAFEILGAYSNLTFKTRNNPEFGFKAKSHAFNGAAKLSYGLVKWKNVELRPELTANYSFIKTPKAESATAAITKIKNIHRVDVAPGINVILDKGEWTMAASVKYRCRFGAKTKIISGAEVIKDVDKAKRGYMEYSLNVMKHNKNNTKFGFKISKTTGKVKGVKGSLNFGVNF